VLKDYKCCICYCQEPATLLVDCIRLTPYCSKHFKRAHGRFYKTTTVKWEVFDLTGALYVGCLSSDVINPGGHAASSDTIRESVRTSWSDNRPADTKILRKRGGKK
jgi:hypothetical protein